MAEHQPQPRPQRPLVSLETGQVAPRAQERFLDGILGRVPIVGERLSVSEQCRRMVAIEVPQRITGTGDAVPERAVRTWGVAVGIRSGRARTVVMPTNTRSSYTACSRSAPNGR
jgi:hypothetical protein